MIDEPKFGRCTLCGHSQEMPDGRQPMASSLASLAWVCVKCGGQISITIMTGGDDPAPDEDISELLEFVTAQAATIAQLQQERDIILNGDLISAVRRWTMRAEKAEAERDALRAKVEQG